jgi:hypothetical protein
MQANSHQAWPHPLSGEFPRESSHREHNTRRVLLRRRLAVIADAGFRWDCVGDLGVSPITRDDNKKRTDPFFERCGTGR